MSRILAIDHGLRHTGVAISDSLKVTARPLPTIHHQTQQELLRVLDELLSQYAVETILLGLPVHADGSESDQTKIVREFAEHVERITAVPIHFVDETATSELVDAYKTTKKHWNQQAGHSHSEVAALLLREYLLSL